MSLATICNNVAVRDAYALSPDFSLVHNHVACHFRDTNHCLSFCGTRVKSCFLIGQSIYVTTVKTNQTEGRGVSPLATNVWHPSRVLIGSAVLGWTCLFGFSCFFTRKPYLSYLVSKLFETASKQVWPVEKAWLDRFGSFRTMTSRDTLWTQLQKGEFLMFFRS